MTSPRPTTRRVLSTLIGSATVAGALVVAGSAAAATETPQIVIMKPDANLSATVRGEERRGNDVDAVIRTIGKGFVADLDSADIARLRNNPDVAHIEPDRPVRLVAGPTAAEAGALTNEPTPAYKTAAATNDPFSGAREITGESGSAIGSTVGATREDGEPGHGGSGASASIWYRWTAPSDGTLRVTTQGSSFDTLLGAYTGDSLGTLRVRAANDDAGSGARWSNIALSVDAGTTYYIAIDGYGGWTGATVLNWALDGPVSPPPAIPNDMFSTPTDISGASGQITGSTVGAKREAGEPNHGSSTGQASIWYRWTAPSTGNLRLTTRGSSFDTLLAAYSGGAIGDLTQLAANDDSEGGLWSTVTIPVTEGTTYRVAIDGWGGRMGSTTLAWSLTEPAPEPTPEPAPAPGEPGGVTRQAASWGLDRVDQSALPLDGTITTAQNGAGVTAYVIDTGVRPDHTDFGGRVTGGYTSITDGNGSNDCNGHGTHVAGTVAGSRYGVAPAATIVPVRVLSCSGSGSTSGVIAGIDYAVRHHQAGTPAVANMSLGGGYSPALNAAVAAGVADGITFVVAAGNSNADACNASPASEPTAVTVGSTTNSDARSYFSNWGSCLDIFAPGSGITSAWYTSPTATNTISGTSMASPHVAGGAALMLSATPSASPAGVVSALQQAATRGVISDTVGSPNLLLNVGTGVAPAPSGSPTSDVTPITAPPVVTTPPASRTRQPRARAPRARTVAAPRLLSATRSRTGLTLRIRDTENAAAVAAASGQSQTAVTGTTKKATARVSRLNVTSQRTKVARAITTARTAGRTATVRLGGAVYRITKRGTATATIDGVTYAVARNGRVATKSVLSISGVTYQVLVNGKSVARTRTLTTTLTSSAVRRAATRGAKVTVRAISSGATSTTSNTIRLR